MRRRAKFSVGLAVGLIICGALPSRTSAWGEDGHRFINLVAAQKLPSDMPEFFRNSGERLSFLGPEPDRWRDSREHYTALNAATAADHFIDIDNPADFKTLPSDRYKYSETLMSRGKKGEKVGYLPYAILEGFQKIEVMFRLWRDPHHAAERPQIEQNIIYYAGVVGHYVADGSQPLHATDNYNGWVEKDNPENFSGQGIHGRFESEFVKANIKPEDFAGLVKPARVLDDPFSDIVGYLLDSNSKVKDVYRMDKAIRWDGSNHNADSMRFVEERLAAGSQMLANLWYTAWIGSGTGNGAHSGVH
jgi:hypothetical protein